MFPEAIINNYNCEAIRAFVVGIMPIEDFIELLYKDDELFDYLQSIVDYMAKKHIVPKRQSVSRSYVEDLIAKYRLAQNKSMGLDRHYQPTVKEYLNWQSHKTASGASQIHGTVADIYYQIDDITKRTDIYSEAFSFSIDVIPMYLAGPESEDYISEHILSKYPIDMKKSLRKKAVKEEIQRLFKRQTKSYPRWIQSSQWPIGTNNKPMIFVKQKNCKVKTEHDDYSEYYFIDEDSGEERIIRQYW